MFGEAKAADAAEDEERAFIMYMRFFNIVTQIKAHQDYKKQKVSLE